MGHVFLRIVNTTDSDYSAPALLVFLIDHVAGTIERKQVVELDNILSHYSHGIHARGNTILCFYEHSRGWGITVSELGPDPIRKHFTLSLNEVS